MFVGISEAKGECFGICGFSLSTIPKNAIITSASISFYPMNRVSVQVESYGEWRVGQIDERTIDSISSFDEIKKIEGNFLLLDREEETYIPVHRIRKVKKKGKVVWKREN